MFQPYFDLNTLYLYIVIGLCIVFFVRNYVNSDKKSISLLVLFAILLVFSVSRKVGINLGGMDSIPYERIFLNRDYARLLENNEFLFVYFTDIIREFTADPVIYRCFCYSLIIYSYLFFIKEFSPKNASTIPYLLVMYPLLMSFNTMRNSMAMAMILIGLVLLHRKKNIFGIAFIVSSVFFHRMSLIYLPVIPFYYLLRNVDVFRSKTFMVVMITVTMLASSAVGTVFQGYILSSDILDENDLYYLGINEGNMFTAALAFFIPLLLIACFMVMNTNKRLFEEYKFLYLIVLYDIAIYPCTFIFGMWRANEYFYIPRLTLWGILLYTFYQRFDKSNRLLVKLIALVCFTFWFVDRLEGIYKTSALMPYVLNW